NMDRKWYGIGHALFCIVFCSTFQVAGMGEVPSHSPPIASIHWGLFIFNPAGSASGLIRYLMNDMTVAQYDNLKCTRGFSLFGNSMIFM
ncbi:MAG: hypothetical protein LBK18_09500, partial [Prevotellaceae bacterium]|nr:hypothetical protein [Prevotellaceae bacterium]